MSYFCTIYELGEYKEVLHIGESNVNVQHKNDIKLSILVKFDHVVTLVVIFAFYEIIFLSSILLNN